MAKIKNPLLAFSAVGRLGKNLALRHSRGVDILEQKPQTPNMKTPAQLEWRHMYQKATALWNALSPTEKQEWETLARPKHMPGFAYFISLALKPNPGLYLPLQGGTMQGNIDMNSFRLLALIDPTLNQEPVTKKYFEDHLPEGGYTQGARVTHSAHQSIPTSTSVALAFNSERYDTDTIHDPVTKNSRLTCKTAGKYLISSNISWSSNTAGRREQSIYLNAGDAIGNFAVHVSGTAAFCTISSTIYQLAINDYVEIIVWQNSGATLQVEKGGKFTPEFMMQRIG